MYLSPLLFQTKRFSCLNIILSLSFICTIAKRKVMEVHKSYAILRFVDISTVLQHINLQWHIKLIESKVNISHILPFPRCECRTASKSSMDAKWWKPTNQTINGVIATEKNKNPHQILLARTGRGDSPNRRHDRDTELTRTRSPGSSRSISTAVEASGPSHSKKSQRFSIVNDSRRSDSTPVGPQTRTRPRKKSVEEDEQRGRETQPRERERTEGERNREKGKKERNLRRRESEGKEWEWWKAATDTAGRQGNMRRRV